MNKEINTNLGEMIFSGTILFLTISFPLFPFSIQGGNVSLGESLTFVFFMFLIIGLGIASLVFSFYGIKNNSDALIIWALVCCIAMIVIMSFAYFQIYTKTIEYLNKPQLKT